MYFGFNTASGKYYCNGLFILASGNNKIAKGSFNTASGKYYCNGGFAMNTAFLPM